MDPLRWVLGSSAQGLLQCQVTYVASIAADRVVVVGSIPLFGGRGISSVASESFRSVIVQTEAGYPRIQGSREVHSNACKV